MNKPKKPNTDEMKFEQALERLEKIVEEMESAKLPLDEVLKCYEEGVNLAKFCTAKLEDAQKKIEILAQKTDGTKELRRFNSKDAEDK